MRSQRPLGLLVVIYFCVGKEFISKFFLLLLLLLLKHYSAMHIYSHSLYSFQHLDNSEAWWWWHHVQNFFVTKQRLDIYPIIFQNCLCLFVFPPITTLQDIGALFTMTLFNKLLKFSWQLIAFMPKEINTYNCSLNIFVQCFRIQDLTDLRLQCVGVCAWGGWDKSLV